MVDRYNEKIHVMFVLLSDHIHSLLRNLGAVKVVDCYELIEKINASVLETKVFQVVWT